MGLHEEIRQHLRESRILPFLRGSNKTLHIAAQEVGAEMNLKDRYPAICTVIDSHRFLDENRLKIVKRVGPGQSSTVEWWLERDIR